MVTATRLPSAQRMSTSVLPHQMFCDRAHYFRLGARGYFAGRRVERIRGEVVEMSPIGWTHVVAKTKSGDQLRDAFDGIGWVNEQNPFSTGDSDPQPDIAVIPGRITDFKGHPEAALLIVEIADTSLEYDKTIKAELYAEAGVMEYWVVDLEHRLLLVYRNPFQGRYQSQFSFSASDSISPVAVPMANIAVADLLP